MSRVLRLRGLGFIAVLLAASASAQPVRIDGVAAVVGADAPRLGAQTILRSDVELEAWLERITSDSFDDQAAPPSGEELTDARERLISRALIVHEAHRLRLDQLDEARRSAAWQRFFETHGGATAVEFVASRVGVASDEFERYVERCAVVRGFVIASSEQGTIVGDAEVEAAWEAGGHPFVGLELEDVREPFVGYLLELRLSSETERWQETLRDRIQVHRSLM